MVILVISNIAAIPMAIILFILACLLLANSITSLYFITFLSLDSESSVNATSFSMFVSLHTFFR